MRYPFDRIAPTAENLEARRIVMLLEPTNHVSGSLSALRSMLLPRVIDVVNLQFPGISFATNSANIPSIAAIGFLPKSPALYPHTLAAYRLVAVFVPLMATEGRKGFLNSTSIAPFGIHNPTITPLASWCKLAAGE